MSTNLSVAYTRGAFARRPREKTKGVTCASDFAGEMPLPHPPKHTHTHKLCLLLLDHGD